MCGICGIYGVKDETLVKRMISILRHRGPDDSGIYADDNISLGHARLSIIDLTERGRQPMSNEDGNVWLSVNGEIYNFMKLKAELERKVSKWVRQYCHPDVATDKYIELFEEVLRTTKKSKPRI